MLYIFNFLFIFFFWEGGLENYNSCIGIQKCFEKQNLKSSVYFLQLIYNPTVIFIIIKIIFFCV